jgi:hypothetical protein
MSPALQMLNEPKKHVYVMNCEFGLDHIWLSERQAREERECVRL